MFNPATLLTRKLANLGQAGYYLYFTDPIYTFLENKRYYDDPYTDKACQELGTGFKGVYRLDLRNFDLVLIDATLSRPSGIQVAPNGTQVCLILMRSTSKIFQSTPAEVRFCLL